MPFGLIKTLMADKGFGFIETSEGIDFFFHQYMVQDGKFDDLIVGDQVEYTIDQSQAKKGKGPRATSVKRC